jgi:hypothetical protein
MDVLLAVPDRELESFFVRALRSMGHRPLREPWVLLPDVLIVDAGPRLVVLSLPTGRHLLLPKPFDLEQLRTALRPV